MSASLSRIMGAGMLASAPVLIEKVKADIDAKEEENLNQLRRDLAELDVAEGQKNRDMKSSQFTETMDFNKEKAKQEYDQQERQHEERMARAESRAARKGGGSSTINKPQIVTEDVLDEEGSPTGAKESYAIRTDPETGEIYKQSVKDMPSVDSAPSGEKPSKGDKPKSLDDIRTDLIANNPDASPEQIEKGVAARAKRWGLIDNDQGPQPKPEPVKTATKPEKAERSVTENTKKYGAGLDETLIKPAKAVADTGKKATGLLADAMGRAAARKDYYNYKNNGLGPSTMPVEVLENMLPQLKEGSEEYQQVVSAIAKKRGNVASR